ncbi:NitT/TauT family transport system substrate-binding protein [Anaerocolumna jejuensis DSM 15929]|uniref:NitT/TauT family transport system substrate-binding protein n=2 Tax=Anaerocolumna TaxID=1843210 RepID=A0A1M6KUL1_9FIRM|nr:NitT/TauT family transport system substrate-binding protein [Anaerocolumna jejuensis DSM 15929]
MLILSTVYNGSTVTSMRYITGIIMKKMKKFTALALTVILALGALTACGSTGNSGNEKDASVTPSAAAEAESTKEPTAEAAADPTEAATQDLVHVRFSAFNGITSAGLRYGLEKGIFKKAGVDLELVEVDDKIAALASNSTDMADVNTSQAIVAAHSGAAFKLVSSMFRTKGAFHLIANPSIKSIADLKGKKIGIAIKGSGLELTVLEILDQNGIKPGDVTLIANGAYQQAYASLVAGQVDATVIHEPFVTIGEKEGKAKLLALGWDYVPDLNTGVIVAGDKIISENPDAVKKVIQGYVDSYNYAKENWEDYIKWSAKYLNLDEEVVRSAYEREDVIWKNDPNIDLDSINKTQELQKKWGFQDEVFDVTPYVDLSFLPNK